MLSRVPLVVSGRSPRALTLFRTDWVEDSWWESLERRQKSKSCVLAVATYRCGFDFYVANSAWISSKTSVVVHKIPLLTDQVAYATLQHRC